MPEGTDAANPTHTLTPIATTELAVGSGKKVKPGWKSTEFWITAVLPQVLLVLKLFGVFDDQSVKEISTNLTTLTHTALALYAAAGAAFYAISRGLTKMKG